MGRYDLDDAAVRRLTAAALAAHPSTGRFAALAVGPDNPMADVARTVERQVFEKSFGNDAGEMAAEYAPYEKDSLFFLVMDRRSGRPAGAARVIDGGGKTLDDAPEHCGRDLHAIVAAHGLHDGARIWDFATLAVLPEHRGGRSGPAVSSLLYRTFLTAGRRAKVRHLVCMLDKRAQRNLALVGVVFEPMAGSGPFAYLGSPETRALYHRFPDLIPAIAAQGTRLRTAGADHAGEIRARGLRGLLIRRVAGRVATRIASGEGLDEHILLPERRRLTSR